jgi:hypothetical protein
MIAWFKNQPTWVKIVVVVPWAALAVIIFLFQPFAKMMTEPSDSWDPVDRSKEFEKSLRSLKADIDAKEEKIKNAEKSANDAAQQRKDVRDENFDVDSCGDDLGCIDDVIECARTASLPKGDKR